MPNVNVFLENLWPLLMSSSEGPLIYLIRLKALESKNKNKQKILETVAKKRSTNMVYVTNSTSTHKKGHITCNIEISLKNTIAIFLTCGADP